jgi:hypothetical protein
MSYPQQNDREAGVLHCLSPNFLENPRYISDIPYYRTLHPESLILFMKNMAKNLAEGELADNIRHRQLKFLKKCPIRTKKPGSESE